MLVLGIETATDWCGIALWDERGPVASRAFINAMELSRRLVPTIHTVLAEEGLSVTNLGGIAVSLGPGSFTGLRIGVATGKTLAQVLDIPIVGIETMDSIAHPYQRLVDLGACVAVTIAARRGQYYIRWYRPHDSNGDRDIHLVTTDRLREDLALASRQVLLLGDAPLKEGLPGTGLPIVDWAHRPHALNIAYMGYQRLKHGPGDDLMSLAPLYIGRSAAEEKREADLAAKG